MACHGQSKKEGIAKVPDQAELQKLWMKEKHRLEIDYCKLYYNGKQILLHDSIEPSYMTSITYQYSNRYAEIKS